MHRSACLFVVALALISLPRAAQSTVRDGVNSVVSILPVRGSKPVLRAGEGRGQVPEASGIVVGPKGLIATAWHVIKAVRRIDVRTADGRILPAKLVGSDEASDIALLRVDTSLPAFKFAPPPEVAQPVCAIGNAYGLDLSVACGVVSAVDVSHAGFNAIEDFVQTDAAANPGSSGGALVDEKGRLVGMISAIFAAKASTNIGVNFAVSGRLLRRVVDDLADDGRVDYVKAGWQLAPLSRGQRRQGHGARIAGLEQPGVAHAAGLRAGDIIRAIGGRPIRGPKGVISALAFVTAGNSVDVMFDRSGQRKTASLSFPAAKAQRSAVPAKSAKSALDCPHPPKVCAIRQAVFPIESFDPLASAVRIASDLLVTNRHAVGAQNSATVHTPAGPLKASVVPSAYTGDLALLQVEGLPDEGLTMSVSTDQQSKLPSGNYYVVGADIARKEVRVFKPGGLILGPANGAPLGRIHVAAKMQPGVSGGALVDDKGKFVGVAVGGGEGRNEALPIANVKALLDGRAKANAKAAHQRLGQALEACAAAIDSAKRAKRGRRPKPDVIAALKTDCRTSLNPGQYLKAARFLAFAREYDAAIELSKLATEQVPNSINARLSYLVSLQLAGRFKQMLPHARWLLKVQPSNPQSLRFAIQSGVWGDDRDLAEQAYQKLLAADPRQAQAARRFIDRPPPAPRPRRSR
ncbi:MAG: trypsin-like peptidase domain-containing protein [Hyphomicrobiaceae bacterium]